jgi:integrase/recombinase XerD
VITVSADPIAAYERDQDRRGLALTTIDKRTRCLRLFEREVGLNPKRQTIERWLDGRGLSNKSRAVWLSHLSCFYKWAVEEGHVREDPTARIRPPKLRRKLPRPIPDDHLEKALANATPVLRCWLLLGAYAGLRCQEIAGLSREDVLVSDGLLRVTEAKGGHERLVPLHPEVLEALELYGLPERGAIFRARTLRRVTPGEVSHKLGDFLHGLGIPSTPHALRHWFGTRLLATTHDLRVVQETMGHRDVTSTAIYADWDRAAAKEGVAALGVTT